jgi:hypothetical protein
MLFGWQSVDSRTPSAGNLPNLYASRTHAGNHRFPDILLNPELGFAAFRMYCRKLV